MKKSIVSGLAGAVRIDRLTFRGLTKAENHGKRLDEISKVRKVADIPPVNTTGLDLHALYEEHVEGVFVPGARCKALHMFVQFPTDLVDGKDPCHMLHHATQFGRRVFGDRAIFANRVDRDEKSQQGVDLFVTPIYRKETKHTAKDAVSTTYHLKALAKELGFEKPTMQNVGRALQQALFEYLRDEMGLVGVKRGSPKWTLGDDWKSSEQLRDQQLKELEAEAEQALAEAYRERAAAAAEAEGAKAQREKTEATEAEAARQRQAHADEAAAALKARREAFEAEKEETERRQAEIRQADAAKARATLAEIQAEAARKSAELREKTAAAKAKQEALDAEKLEVERDRKLHADQIALLRKGADDGSTLNLRLGSHPRGDAGFVMDEPEMSAGEWVTYMAPWNPSIAAIAQWIAKMVEAARDFAAKLLDREAEIGRRGAALANREAAAEQELAERNERQQREHAAQLDALDERHSELSKLEADAARASEGAAAREAAAKVRETAAEQTVLTGERWIRALAKIDANPDVIVIDDQGTASFDTRIAKTFGAEFAETMKITMPKWADEALTSKFELAERFHALAQREHRAKEAVQQLETLIERAGPILSPTQKAVVNDAGRSIRNIAGLAARFDTGI